MAIGSNDHDALREQIAAYVFGTLGADERRVLAAHLAECAACSAEVRDVGLVSGALARGVPQVDPPPALRARVLASVAGRAAAPGGSVGTVDTVGSVAEVRAIRPPLRAPAWPAWLAAAASLVLAAALGIYAIRLRDRVTVLDGQMRDAARRADASQQQLADVRRIATEAQAAVAVVTAPDVARVDLAGQPVAPAASARAFLSPSRGIVINASNLPPLPPQRIYQLWVIAGTPVSAGLLQPDSSGRVDAVLGPPSLGARPATMAVTIEPAGGVPQPTGAMYLVGSVSN